MIQRLAPAKTNLWLRVVGKREDGFHNIETRMVALDFGDTMDFRFDEQAATLLTCTDQTLPTGEDNLVLKAIRALEKNSGRKLPCQIHLAKAIPHGAGLGGGSSDAATTLLVLNEYYSLGYDRPSLAAIGSEFGSDVAFFIYECQCDCSGRGELVVPCDPDKAVGEKTLLLVKPGFSISAAFAYQNYASSQESSLFDYAQQEFSWGAAVNDLERPVFEKFPLLGSMKTWLLEQDGCQFALLSGSGSTMLAAFESDAQASAAQAAALALYGDSTWTKVCRTGSR